MAKKGLIVDHEHGCLTCVHHSKQLKSAQTAWDHFTIVQNWHRGDSPNINEVLESLHQGDEGHDPDQASKNLLDKFYGKGHSILLGGRLGERTAQLGLGGAKSGKKDPTPSRTDPGRNARNVLVYGKETACQINPKVA